MPVAFSLLSNNAVSITLAAGESVQSAVTMTNGGAPFDLTGYTLKMQISMPLLLDTANGGIVVSNPTQGVAEIVIADAMSAAFTPGSYGYEFWTISPSGESIRQFLGPFIVLKSITPIP